MSFPPPGQAPSFPPPTGAPVSFPPPSGQPVAAGPSGFAPPGENPNAAATSVVGVPTHATIPLNKLAPEAALRRLELTIVRRL